MFTCKNRLYSRERALQNLKICIHVVCQKLATFFQHLPNIGKRSGWSDRSLALAAAVVGFAAAAASSKTAAAGRVACVAVEGREGPPRLAGTLGAAARTSVGRAGVVANFWKNFGNISLVFGCIGTDLCK